jgi:HEAT repeat protein
MKKDEDPSLWVGPIGPIPILADDDPRLVARHRASRIADSAVECPDLIELILRHPDPVVRMEAVPRLKARFPKDGAANDTLIRALRDEDEAVRCAAISAVADLALPGAGDLLVGALSDREPDVRFFAAIGLQTLADPRAPADPEAFAYRQTDN